MGADTRLAPPPCIDLPPTRMANPLVRYVTVSRGVWSIAIRGQITNSTVGYIAVTLSNHGDKFGRDCFPGVELLASDVLCAERTVIRAMNWLTDFGFIHLHKRGARKLGKANHYHLAIPAPLAVEQGRWSAGEPWWTEDPAKRHVVVMASAA